MNDGLATRIETILLLWIILSQARNVTVEITEQSNDLLVPQVKLSAITEAI